MSAGLRFAFARMRGLPAFIVLVFPFMIRSLFVLAMLLAALQAFVLVRPGTKLFKAVLALIEDHSQITVGAG